jgi:hypothetical protein
LSLPSLTKLWLLLLLRTTLIKLPLMRNPDVMVKVLESLALSVQAMPTVPAKLPMLLIRLPTLLLLLLPR